MTYFTHLQSTHIYLNIENMLKDSLIHNRTYDIHQGLLWPHWAGDISGKFYNVILFEPYGKVQHSSGQAALQSSLWVIFSGSCGTVQIHWNVCYQIYPRVPNTHKEVCADIDWYRGKNVLMIECANGVTGTYVMCDPFSYQQTIHIINYQNEWLAEELACKYMCILQKVKKKRSWL